MEIASLNSEELARIHRTCMLEFAVSEGREKERQGETSQKEKEIADRQWERSNLGLKLKGDRFDLSTRPLTPSTMAQRAFEIDELARLVS